MTQEILLWALVAGLLVFTWVMAVVGLDDDHHTRYDLQGNASPEHRDREEPHDNSPPQSKLAT